MAKLHARVTIEVDITDEKVQKMIEDCRIPSGGLCDYDLSVEEAEYFLKNGKIDGAWDDPGYIPDCWFTADALNEGLITMEEACQA